MNRNVAHHALEEVYLAHPSAQSTDVLFIRQAEGEHETDPGMTEDEAALTERGRAQALAGGRYMARQQLSSVYCADTRPAFETAALVAAACRLPLTAVYKLRDIDFREEGCLPGAAALSEAVRAFSCYPRWDVFAGAERTRVYRHRVIQAVEALVARHSGETMAIICSGATINAYLGMILDIPRDVFFVAGPGSISSARIDEGRYAVLSLNNSLHLAETQA
jgi:probable phosphoglycerate mutase